MRVPEIQRLTPLRCTVLPARSKKAFPILSEAIYLDTETSHNFNEDDGTGTGWVYQWAFRFCREFAFGRKPTELFEALRKIETVNKLAADGVHCIIYIHNASYDLSYLKDWFFRYYDTSTFKMLATSNHHYITFEIGPWIVRCSYKLSNRSLAKWGKDLGIKDRKRTGLIDYNVRRYQDTKLTKRDWVYMFYDVIALEECVLEEMRIEHDNLNSIPLTSTGYVRRDTRKQAAADKKNREEFKRTRLDRPTYANCRTSFAGGLTHGNRFFAGKTVRGVIRHRDFRSDYPSQIRVSTRCPRGKWNLLYEWRPSLPEFTWERVDSLKGEYCLLITAIVEDLQLRPGVTLPYAQESKFAFAAREDYVADIVDNGRLIRTKGRTTITMTEIDWDILRRQYDMKTTIVKVVYAIAGRYPQYLMDVTDQYYRGKYEYKQKVKKLRASGAPDELIRDAEASLAKSKARLNSIYGMCATDVVRISFTMNPATAEWTHTELTASVIEDALDQYYSKRSSFAEYQHGIYVTALARAELMEYVELIGYKNFLYADTDSIFYISTPEIEERIEQRNKEKYDNAIALGAYIEVDGKKITYDAFDLEDEAITAFRFLHAKAYAYETADGELHTTVAGVAHRDAKGFTREQELGSIDNLKNGMCFRRCGSTTVTYLEHAPHELEVDGHRIEAAAAAILLPTTKTLKDNMHKDEDIYYEEVDEGHGETVENYIFL